MKKILVIAMTTIMILGGVVGCGTEKEGSEESNGSSTNTENTKNEKNDASENTTSKEDADGFIEANIAGKGVKEDGSPYKVGMIFGDLDSEYIIYFAEYAQYLFEKAGCEVTMSNSNVNLETEAGYIDDCIEKNVDAVVMTSVDSNGSSAAVQKLIDKGIHVVCISRAGENVDYDLLVQTCDNVEAGEKCMTYVAEQAAGSDVDVISVTGSMGGTDAQNRDQGYQNILEKNSNIHYTLNDCDWSSTKAEAAVTDSLTANPDLFAVVSHSAAMTAGVYSGLVQADRAYKVGEEGHIIWTSIDGAAADLDMIRQGYMDSSCDQSPLTCAITAVKGCLDYTFQGKDLKGQTITVETNMITPENVNDEGWWGDYDVETLKDDVLWSLTEEKWEEASFK